MKNQKQLALNLCLRDAMTFSNYFAADNTKLITFLSTALEKMQGQFAFLWGAAGVGKTHLLMACCNYLEQHKLATFYLSLKEATNIQPAIFDDIDNLALICIDDLDVIVGERQWEEAIFHLFNKVIAAQKMLLVAANSAPQGLAFALPDLQSRMCSDIIWQVQPLSDEEKIQALRQRAKLRGLDLPKIVANYLLNHYARDMHNLFACLDILDKASLEEQRKLTVPFVKDVL